MGKLSHREDKLTQKKAKKTWEKEKREKEKEKKEREEKITKKKRQLALVASVKKMDVGEKEQAGEMETWSLRGKALEGRRKDWKKEKLAEKVEREAEGKKTASEKMKLAPKEEKKIEKIGVLRVLIVAQQVKNPTNIHEDAGLTHGLAQWVKDLVLPQATM